MPLEILHSVRNDALLERAADFLRQYAALGEIIVAAPTRDAADDFVRGLAEPALAGVHRTTVDSLAAAIAQRELASRGYAPLSNLAHEAIAARIVEQAQLSSPPSAMPARGDTLQPATLLDRGQGPAVSGYFAPVASFPGFPRALARTLRDLRLGRIPPRDLGPDLTNLLQLYETELSTRRLADQAMRFSIAANVAHPLVGLPLLLLDPPLDS